MNEANMRILIVEDEPQMKRFLRTSLSVHGFYPIEASTQQEAMIAITTQSPELVLMDLGLPDGDGIALTRQIREWSRIPILVISARGREDDKVTALDAGADDYLTKPFGMNELFARIRVAVRHLRESSGVEAQSVFDFGDLHVDLVRRQVTRKNEEIHLTPIEYKLLVLLVQHAGKVLTYRHILKEVWGLAYANQVHYVRVHMAELRKKIESNPSQPKQLITEPGVGYRFRDALAYDLSHPSS